MKLKSLIKELGISLIKGSKDVDITGISADSRTVSPGNLFIAKKGSVFDGHQFVEKAVEAGAAAILTDMYDPSLKVTQLIDSRPLTAPLAARYYGEPSKQLFTVGVTGTKGKTTTTYLIKQLLEPCGLIGTVETITGQNRFFSPLTTQDILTNQKLLREMVLSGCRAAALEVSSHGLHQGRVEGIEFNIGLFTNLYPDHLDYHPSLQEYAAVKKTLLQQVKECAIFNLDDPWSSFFRADCSVPQLTYAIEQEADIQAKEIRLTPQGTDFILSYRGQTHPFTTPLMGRFNISNALGAIAVALQRGQSLAQISASLSTFSSVPGRLQPVWPGMLPQVFVDFAHTGEALANVLKTLKEISRGKLLVVFGCGGDRDPQRRRAMAEAAEQYADQVVITNDNPRKEDPEAIVRQILASFRDLQKVCVELDRKKAIHLAIQMAGREDIVLIAGKGHERVQIFAHHTLPFEDASVAKEALQILGHSAILAHS